MRKKTYHFDFTLADTKEHKVLPKNTEVEKKVLGYLVKHQNDFDVYYKYLKPKGMFYDDINDKIWQLIVQKQSSKVSYQANDLKAEFMAKNDKEAAFEALGIISNACLPSEMQNLCLKLNEYWIQRTFYRMGHYILSNAMNEDVDKMELLGNVSESTSKIFLHIAGMKERSLNDAATELIQELCAIQLSPNGILGVPSSIGELNNVIKGYRKSNLIILAAGTGEGKTTLALQDAHHSLKAGIPIGYISLEMATQELMLVMACSELGIDTKDVLQATTDQRKIELVGSYIDKIQKMPLHITDKAGMTIGEIKAIAKGWKDKYKIQQLFVDHMHLINGDVDYPNAEQKFTDIANKLKELSKELEIPIISLAQLARKEQSDKRMHQVTDIKYAGGIEQAADVVILIFRPSHHGIETDSKGNSTIGKAKIIIGKLRLLPKKNISCTFNGLKFAEESDMPIPPPKNDGGAFNGIYTNPTKLPSNFFDD